VLVYHPQKNKLFTIDKTMFHDAKPPFVGSFASDRLEENALLAL